MNFFIIPSGDYSGKFNMEVDSRLAEKCGSDEAYLRFYGWKPYCISLGRNQNNNDINFSRASQMGLDIVRRPTGGRAILHADELTYSFVFSTSFGLSQHEIYILASHAIIHGIRKYDPSLKRVALNETQPDFANFYKTPHGALCFATAAKGEVKHEDKKLIGSAQRKLKNSVLQHGSILCGSYHEKLISYLNVNTAEKERSQKYLKDNTTNLQAILNEKVDMNKLIELIVEGFEFELRKKFKELKLIRKDINFTNDIIIKR